MPDDKILGWHFVNGDRTLMRAGAHHGRAKKIRKNQVLHVPPPLEMCARGLHLSEKPLDALRYAEPKGGALIVCRAEVWGARLVDSDKVCAEYRRVLWWADCTRTLHEFACWCAEQASEFVEKPDPCSIAAIKAKRRWLAGEIGNPELAAARDAAWDAARAAAWAAARAAARTAAWAAEAAADDAAWAAARTAAWAAIRAATWAPAWAAEAAAWGRKLTEMLLALEN